jgi:c-di-GMP-binding flagellar brake protein YcgR
MVFSKNQKGEIKDIIGLGKGKTVYYSVMPELTKYSATVVSIDDNIIVLRTKDVQDIQIGRYIIITDSYFKYYTAVVTIRDDIVTLKQVGQEQRSFFRVDDIFPLEATKIKGGASYVKSKIFRGCGFETSEIDLPDETINPKLWEMLVDINAKLTSILDKLFFDSEGFIKSENKIVNLSGSGIRFTMNEKVEPGDKLELKMLLPTGPPIGILTYGSVVRVNDIGNSQYEVSLQFSDMDDEVREEIIRYAINRQREIIRKERQQKE